MLTYLSLSLSHENISNGIFVAFRMPAKYIYSVKLIAGKFSQQPKSNSEEAFILVYVIKLTLHAIMPAQKCSQNEQINKLNPLMMRYDS